MKDAAMESNDSFICSTQGDPPQDQSPSRPVRVKRRSTLLSINSEILEEIDDHSSTTGASLNLSGLRSLNIGQESDDDHISCDSNEDETARMMALLMQNHSQAVTESLIERTMLIQSVIWLSHHVPGCVLKLLFETILRSRNSAKDIHENAQAGLTGLSDILNAMQCLSSDQDDTGDMKNEQADVNCNTDPDTYLQPLNDSKEKETIHQFAPVDELSLPIAKNHDSALLFVDMSGFTKISTILDIESLSNAINSYFQLIVNEVTNHGGDILKFAGDAIFAEWKASHRNPDHNIEYCAMQAAACGASIVANCSDYPIYSKPVGVSRASIRLESTRQSYTNRRSSVLSRASIHSSGEGSRRSVRGSICSADEYHTKRASIVSTDSNQGLEQFTRRSSTGQTHPHRRVSAGPVLKPVKLATLNVKCGVGVGRVVCVHVGNDTRREYLILGDPIDQVANAEGAATNGEVFASPEALTVLSKCATFRLTCDEAIREKKPMCIAERQQRFFDIEETSSNENLMSNNPESLLHRCEDLKDSELRWLKRMISLYVHPAVVNDENKSPTQISLKRESDVDRHVSEAELRNIFVMFISPVIDYKLTGDEIEDRKLINLLNDIMNLITRRLDRAGGQLRQFIVDDKGVVLICTFGLRGSTFPNMVSLRALPLTRSIHEALQEELGVTSKIGATFGRVYCGVVGGLTRHEYAVLGPSVNLAARLMASNFNPGILVDKSIRLLSSQVYFKSLPAVTAKGYDEPVPIFEPMKSNETQWGKLKPNFTGRSTEIKLILQIAKGMSLNSDTAKFILVTAASGTGKSCMIAQTTARVKAMVQKMKKTIIVARHVSNEGDSRVPFSLFRSIFKNILDEMMKQVEDEAPSKSHSSTTNGESCVDFSLGDIWDNLSLASQSTKDSSAFSTDANRFRYICEELNAPSDFTEIVGRRLLGIRDKTHNSSAASNTSVNVDIIIDFLAKAFIRCTKHATIVLLALDDIHEMDEMSWKVVQAIFERAKNVLILGGSRPMSTNPLAVTPEFWDKLYGQFMTKERFIEIHLQPLTGYEVRDFIAASLDFDSNEIDPAFWRNISNVSGGMPHYLSYVIETIKRQQLFTRQEDGLITLKSEIKDKDNVSFGSVSELLLCRLDALDSSVRNALQLAAVIGTEFEFVDACLAYDEMYNIMDNERTKAALALQEALDVAVEEGIIEELYAPTGNEENEDILVEDPIEAQTTLRASLGNIMFSLKGGYRKMHPAYAENRKYRFCHDTWKTSIINVMLDERVQEIHEHIAIVLEREIDIEDDDTTDLEKKIRIVRHWNASGHFINSSDLALKIGKQLMMMGLNSQSILCFDDVLNTLKDLSADKPVESHGGISVSVINALEPSELENLIKLNIAKGRAYSTLGKGHSGAEALQSALDILQNASCANSEHFDRSVSFPIFSGLFVVLKMGAIQDDENCSYEKDLTKKFVEQARLNKDPVHYGRALAMQGETLGRLGLFEEAIQTIYDIDAIYDIETQHAQICNAYGSDRVAQAYAHSVNWHLMLGRTDAATNACKYILQELAPKSDPRNVHNSFCLLYSTIIAMKETGDAIKAKDALIIFVVEPFEEHFGSDGTTFSKPLFDPLLMLLDLQGRQEEEIGRIDEYLSWALNEESFSVCSPALEKAWAAMCASPKTWLGEICYFLAKRPECTKQKDQLVATGLGLIESSVDVTEKLPFAHKYATKKLAMLNSYYKEVHNN